MKNMWFLSMGAHVLLGGIFFLLSSHYAVVNTGQSLPQTQFTQQSKDFKRLQTTKAHSVSVRELKEEVGKIHKVQQHILETRQRERSEHEQQLLTLQQDKQKTLAVTEEAKKVLSSLTDRQKNAQKELQNLETEVSQMEMKHHEFEKKQKLRQREQSFSESVFKESLYSDGTVLQAYRESMSAHISAYWKKNQLTGLDSETACIIQMKLLPTARIESLHIEQSSGHLVFDTNALAALSRAEPFPQMKHLHADKVPKVIRVIFKQEGCGVINDLQ